MISLFKINFLNSDYNEAINKLKAGQFMVVPSGPGLATIDYDIKYWEALVNSDFALPDSSFMVLLYRLIYSKKIKKFSGAKFIRYFLRDSYLKEANSLFLINPSIEELELNKNYLKKMEIFIKDENQYVAPIYDREEIIDEQLLMVLEALTEKPKFILINLLLPLEEKNSMFKPIKYKYEIGKQWK